MSEKLFAGPTVRRLREEYNLSQSALGKRLNISTSYVSQIETNQRPITARILIAMSRTFSLDPGVFVADDADRLTGELREALADPIFSQNRPGSQELKQAVSHAPSLAHAFLALHATYRRLTERLRAVDDAVQATNPESRIGLALMPYEAVRDHFYHNDNYVDQLDRAAEDIAEELGLATGDPFNILRDHAWTRHGVRVLEADEHELELVRSYDKRTKSLMLGSSLSRSSRMFVLATQIGYLEHDDLIDDLVAKAEFQTRAAENICRQAMANYFAGALVMPYGRFLLSARKVRYDILNLSQRYGASIEQVCHRISNLQRPGAKGVPFFFLKVDRAGNIIKRHSAIRFQFARYGGACPLWNVHRSFEAPNRFLVQHAEMPDGERYICIARSVVQEGARYGVTMRQYALGLGCEASYADQVVYADGLDLRSDLKVVPIGVNCRMCERTNCLQRAGPPINRPIHVDKDRRSIVPFRIG